MSCRAEPDRWASYHLFYHGSGDRLLSGLVLPVVRSLWRQGRIERFFFLRYGLGGPHVRLRLLGAPRQRDEIDGTVRRAAAEFFREHPAETRLRDEEIRSKNRQYVTHGDEDLEVVYPNNTLAEVPFEPEVERYGGPDLIGHSLEFFCVSSACVLRVIEEHENVPKTRRLSQGMRALLRQALGFSAKGDKLARLAGYAAMGEGPGTSLLTARANEEFERRPNDYAGLVREEVEISRVPRARRRIEGPMLTSAARALEIHLRGVADPVWWRIVGSQLHMTANRLDLMNVEEVYLGQILRRALAHAADEDAELLSHLLAEPEPADEVDLASLATASLAQLAEEEADGL